MLLILSLPAASARVMSVPGDFATVSEAVNAAGLEDIETVEVDPDYDPVLAQDSGIYAADLTLTIQSATPGVLATLPAVSLYSGELTLRDVEVDVGEMSGPGMIQAYGGTLVLENVLLQGKKQGQVGIYATDATVEANGLELTGFTEGYAVTAYYGQQVGSSLSWHLSGLYVHDNSQPLYFDQYEAGGAPFDVSIAASRFENLRPTSDSSAGIKAANLSSLRVESSSFAGVGSAESTCAGAITTWEVGSLDIVDSTFSEGRSAYRGGFVLSTGSGCKLNISGCTFEGGVSDGQGGAADSEGPTTITDSRFEGNRASVAGAVMVWWALDLSDSTFVTNEADSYGGAVVSLGTIDVRRAFFCANSSPDAADIYHGATEGSIDASVFITPERSSAAVSSTGIALRNLTMVGPYAQAVTEGGAKSLVNVLFSGVESPSSGTWYADYNLY